MVRRKKRKSESKSVKFTLKLKVFFFTCNMMADQSIDLLRSGLFTCSNEFHVGFGHSFLFPALVEARQRRDVSAPILIKSCLRKSGLSYHCLESLQLHSCFFHQCFLSSAPYSNLDKGASEGDCLTKFTTHDYFEALLDGELGWFKYYKQMIPFIRLELIIRIVSSMDMFFSCQLLEVNSLHRHTTQIILLLTSTLEMFFNIVCDLCSGSQLIDESPHNVDSCDKSCHRSFESQFHNLCEELSNRVAKFLNILFINSSGLGGSRESFCFKHNLMEEDRNVKNYFIELVSLTLLTVNPFSSTTEVIDSLHEMVVGRVHQPPNLNPSKTEGKNLTRNRKKLNLISTGLNGIGSKQVHIKHLRKNNSMEKENKNKEYEQELMTDSKVPKSGSINIEEGGGTSNIDLTDDGKEEVKFHPIFSNSCDISLFLLKCLRKNVPAKLFVNIVCYYSRGEDEIHNSFYNNLFAIINEKSEVRICDHYISRQKLFSQVEKLLLDRTSLKEWKLNEFNSAVYPDRKQFNLSPAEEVFLTGRQLAGEKDLALLRLASDQFMPGWIELITLGMQNSDYINWWDRGFLAIVLDKIEFLSTETNVMQVLCVLHELSKEEPIQLERVERMTDLLTRMLHQLPSLLQERLILSKPFRNGDSTSPSAPHTVDFEGGREQDLLWRLKDEEDVLKSITTWLNRLTSDNVHVLLPQVLMLCLYHKDAVLTQTLQVAIDNKGQVKPVVMMLRHMPEVCNVQDSPYAGSLLMSCLRHVLSNTQLDERSEENIVEMLTMLTQGYHRLVDITPETSQWVSDGVVSVKELIETLIIPTIHRQMTLHANKRDEEISPTSKSEPSANALLQLPICTVLQILASMIQTVSSDKFSYFYGVVMVQALNSLCVRHWSLLAADNDKSCDDNGDCDGNKSHSKAIWQSTRNCLDFLIERLKTEGTLDSSNLDWLLDASFSQGGLPSLVLVYPLFQKHSDFQMIPILQSIVKDMAATQNEYAVLISLLGFGQVNSSICQTVTDFIATDNTMSMLSVNGQLLTSVVAQVLCQSSGCDMVRTCCLLESVVSRYLVGKEDLDQDLIGFMDSRKMNKGLLIRCLCVQYLTHGLMCTVSSQDNSQTTVGAVNYQTACQALLEKQTNESDADTDYKEMMVYTFVQCCSLLCLPQVPTMPQAFQGLHVLAMTLLASLTNLREKVKKERDAEQKQKADGKRKNWIWKNKQTGGSGCNSGEERDKRLVIGAILKKRDVKTVYKGDDETVKEWMDDELLLSLRDVVMCIEDDSIAKQLEKQLAKMWAVIGNKK